MTQRLVLLGTGTDIGKTYVGCALARALNELKHPTLALKPIESGVRPDHPSDACRLSEVSCLRPHPERPLHCFALPDPVSPHLAARRAGLALDLRRVDSWVRAEEAQYNTLHYTLIESAGGVFSPLHKTATNFELAQLFPKALWILVAPDSLGVLHDLTACLTALGQRGRTPDFVVLSAARPPDASTGANAAELERLGITSVTAVVRRDEPASLQPLITRLVSRFDQKR